MKNLVLLFIFVGAAISSTAQTMQISGVVSESNSPLPGVNVIISGTTKGVQTDFDSNFSIEAEKDQTLVFSNLGFETKKEIIKNYEKLIIRMPVISTLCFPSADYYLPYKIHELHGYDENWLTIQNIQISLLKIPGVQIGNSNGFTSPSIRMRGNDNTIVIVDGVRYDASILNALNPADIEHISVATDAAASNYLINN